MGSLWHNPGMLLPRFTLRTALVGLVGFALLGAIAASAARGAIWAIAVSSGVLGLAVVFAIHAVLFTLLLGVASLLPTRSPRQSKPGPFATHRLPPQLLPPPRDGDAR